MTSRCGLEYGSCYANPPRFMLEAVPRFLDRLLRLACVKPGEYSFPNRTFINVPAHVARPLIRRARRNLKRLENPQLELPFNSELGAEEYLLPDFSQRIPR